MNENGKITLKLLRPIQHGSETISELVLREPKAGDFKTLPANPTTGDILRVLSRISNQPPSVIDELSMVDLTEVTKVFGDFFPNGPKTGETP